MIIATCARARFAVIGMTVGASLLPTAAWAKDLPAPQTKTQTRILFSDMEANGATSGQQFLWAGLERFRTASADQRLAAECTAPPSTPTSAFLAFLVEPVVSLITDTIKTALDDELKKYGAEFKAAEQTRYWRSVGGGAVPAWRCFRVTRTRTVTEFKSDGAVLRATRTVDFDFIGQVATVGSADREVGNAAAVTRAFGTKVRPLRVYLGRPLAKGSTVAMTANLSFEAIWRDGNGGKRDALFTVPVLDRKFTSKGPPEARSWSTAPYYYPAKLADGSGDNPDEFPNWAQMPLLPLVPIGAAGPEGTAVNVSFAAAEVGDGDGKAALKAIIKLFGKTQDDLNSLLTKAGKKLVDPEAPAPPAKPDMFCGSFTPQADGSINGSWTKVEGSCPTS